MTDAKLVQQQAALWLQRLWPRLEVTFRAEANAAPADWRAFEKRLRREWERLFGLLLGLYGGHYDFFYHFEELLGTAARGWFARPGQKAHHDYWRRCA
jgi:amylosucrase